MRALLLALLLLGFKARTQAQAVLDFVKTMENFSTGGDGTTAMVGNVLIYTITVRNLTSQNFVASRLYDNVPAGVRYVPGSTTLNGAAIADNSGVMPFAGSGRYINSPTYGSGILAPNATATIRFRVIVTANGGRIFNNATIEATQNMVATIQATNTVYTDITEDDACNVVYQVTPVDGASNSTTYSYLRIVNTDDGTGGPILAQGPGGFGAPPQADAFTKARIKRPTDPPGGERVQLLNGSAAIAYDRDSNRIYFVNNSSDPQPPLCYYDLDTDTIYRYTGYQLETNTNDGWNINRMGKGSDGYFYALTSNARDLIRFRILPGNIPEIVRLGQLNNASTNGSRNVRDEAGGDLFADGSGKLYLIANSSNMYKINPTTRVATFMGRVNPFPGTSQSLAIDANGNVYINGAYHDVYRLDLQTMEATRINSSNTDVYTSGDYTACGFPVLASSIIADKTYRNINGSSTVVGGDTVEYIITVTNIGNINAAGVYMYDYIPPSTTYLANTTRLNGTFVPDVSGTMPFAVSGGRLVNSVGEDPGIVRPGGVNAAVVTFRVVTEPNRQVCNQSRITLYDADGNVMFVNSSDPGNIGQTPTCFYSDGVLPLTNLKFKGSLNEDKSVLNWTMNGDENVAYYEVEFSSNGTAFGTIGKVAGKGNNQSANAYQYTDAEHTFATVRYYRLKVVQKGGSYSYSGIIRLNAKELDVEAVPNPFDRNINVQVRLKSAETVRIRLVDFSGREVYTTTEKLSVGSHSISINLPAGLVKGIYVLDVKAGNEQIFQKKMIKN
ncbi:T9SS type A sorting domain-containing protein [Longitalea luteola]|uniref:T9SS type A sorting domain-containing protein n=1 Tax=Longitalea luteola TaxID=2812563 RepID=UPI001A97696B|nr:T9SS type A sorting domain-containing protein [Longitalea luteola]